MEREPHADAARSAPTGFHEPPAAREGHPLHQCEACGQTYDLRNLGLVLHHLERGHAPRPML